MHIMTMGSVGSGKTLMAIEETLQSFKIGYNVYSNINLNLPKPWKLHKWQNFSEIKDAKCGVLFIDEASMYLDSRKFASLEDDIKDLIKEHRKHHLRIITTTQDVSFIDKIFRILCDEVRIMKKYNLPFIGWFIKDCIRPNIVCKDCGIIREDDGIGDQSTKLKKLLGFGTIYTYSVYPATIIGEQEDASGNELERKNIPALRSGWFLWSNKKFGNIYNTSELIGLHAHKHRINQYANQSNRPR